MLFRSPAAAAPDLAAALQALDAELDQCDLAAADHLAALVPALQARGAGNQVATLATQVQALDYAAARSTVQALLARLDAATDRPAAQARATDAENT